jgi:hypothetical protein
MSRACALHGIESGFKALRCGSTSGSTCHAQVHRVPAQGGPFPSERARHPYFRALSARSFHQASAVYLQRQVLRGADQRVLQDRTALGSWLLRERHWCRHDQQLGCPSLSNLRLRALVTNCVVQPATTSGPSSQSREMQARRERTGEPPRECRRLRILAVMGDLKYGKRKQGKEAHRDAIFG